MGYHGTQVARTAKRCKGWASIDLFKAALAVIVLFDPYFIGDRQPIQVLANQQRAVVDATCRSLQIATRRGRDLRAADLH